MFNYVANNKWAQIVAGLGVGYALLRLYGRHKQKQGERKLRLRVEKAQRSANEAAQEQVETIRIETNERIERAEQARNTVTAAASASELPDAAKSRYFGE